MFASTSRYQSLASKPLLFTTPEGRHIPYVPRRFLPPDTQAVLPQTVSARRTERLDNLAARVLGDSEQFWRLADVNSGMNPFTLLDETDARLNVPSPHDASQWASGLGVAREARLPGLLAGGGS